MVYKKYNLWRPCKIQWQLWNRRNLWSDCWIREVKKSLSFHWRLLTYSLVIHFPLSQNVVESYPLPGHCLYLTQALEIWWSGWQVDSEKWWPVGTQFAVFMGEMRQVCSVSKSLSWCGAHRATQCSWTCTAVTVGLWGFCYAIGVEQPSVTHARLHRPTRENHRSLTSLE